MCQADIGWMKNIFYLKLASNINGIPCDNGRYPTIVKEGYKSPLWGRCTYVAELIINGEPHEVAVSLTYTNKTPYLEEKCKHP